MFLDMNGTFMFDHDRLGNDQDFYPTYHARGGRHLDRKMLNAAVRKVIERLDVLYKSGVQDTNFPQVLAVAREVLGAEFDADEHVLIEQTIAAHELGQLSDLNASTLILLSKRFHLYVVSNLWSKSGPWKTYLTDRLGVATFSGWLFSSDVGINKPAREFFEQALVLANVGPAEVVMVGDDPERDIRPAVEFGMKTVWVSHTTSAAQLADYTIADISQLV
jgi:FMN phosphatase YigB (HAD superfamily)